MLKVELHAHTSDDPADLIPHSTTDLIDRASQLGFAALAITLHDRQLDVTPWASYGSARGVTLIPGVERTIEGKHVLLLNFSSEAEHVETFEDLARIRARSEGLVIAPHPFFPLPSCLRDALRRHPDLFDAVEFNGFYTKHLDFNRGAVEWAKATGTPIVGNSDVHRLHQLGRTFSLIDADSTPAAICAAVRAGRVEVRTSPLSVLEAARHFLELTAADIGRLRPLLR